MIELCALFVREAGARHKIATVGDSRGPVTSFPSELTRDSHVSRPIRDADFTVTGPDCDDVTSNGVITRHDERKIQHRVRATEPTAWSR